MESSLYSSLVFKVQSLEKRLNIITNETRGRQGLSAFYLTNKSQHYESILNLLELAKSLKHELNCSLKYSPTNRQTLKMYNKVCILESELHNLVNCQPIINSNQNPKGCGSKDTFRVLCEKPKRVSYDFTEVFPKHYHKHHTPFVSQEIRTKTSLDEYFENITEPDYDLKRKNSSDSLGASSYYSLSSESSSSRTSREPLYIRISKSLYQAQPSAPRTRRRTPERVPIYIKKSKDLSERKRDRKKEHKPIVKDLPLRFGIHKSGLNKINVRADDDVQTQETEVFLVKKKRKPSAPRELSKKNYVSGRYLISRLKKVKSNKSSPLVSKRNKSPKSRKSLTPEHREKNYYVKKHSNKRIGISKFKDSSFDNSIPKFSEDSSYGEGKRKNKPFKKRFGLEKYNDSKRSPDSKPIAVTKRSDVNHVFYSKGNSFILLPKKFSGNKDLRFSRNHGNGEPYSKVDIKPGKISNRRKRSNLSHTDSTYEILGSHQNSNLKGSNISVRRNEVNRRNSNSKYRPYSKTHRSLHGVIAGGEMNQYDFLDTNIKLSDYNLNSINNYISNYKSNRKFILLKVINDPMSELENKRSISRIMNVNTVSKGTNIPLIERQILNNDNSVHNNHFGVNTTATSIYLASVPQTLPLNTNIIQNQPSSNNITRNKVKNHNFIVNSDVNNVQNKPSLHSLSILNPNHSSSSVNSSPLGRSINSYSNKKLHSSNKLDLTVFPMKTATKDMKNSLVETKGSKATLQNTKSVSKGSPPPAVQLHSRDESRSDVSRSVGNNESVAGKKSKVWLPRTLSKLSIISKKAKKPNKEKDSESVPKESSKSNLNDISKHGSEEKKPSSEKIPKSKSWTTLQRTMSSVGSFLKGGKANTTETKASEKKLKKQSSLMKRIFSKDKLSKSKTRMNEETEAELSLTGPIGTSGYEGDKTSTATSPSSFTSSHSPNPLNNPQRIESKTLNGYQVASKVSKMGSNIGKRKQQPIPSSSTATTKKQTLKDNPNAFNYSLHYSKEKRNCVEMDLVPSISCLVYSCCPETEVKPCDSKTLWSMGETVLCEHGSCKLNKHNKYHEFFFKPNKCKGCAVHDKKVSTVYQKRGARKSLNSQRSSGVCSYDKDRNLYNDSVGYLKNIPVATSNNVLSDSSDDCDWKKIADEIK